jgi:hypothetical protein
MVKDISQMNIELNCFQIKFGFKACNVIALVGNNSPNVYYKVGYERAIYIQVARLEQ